MPGAIEMFREEEIKELWQKCCGLREMSLNDFLAHIYESLPRSPDLFQWLIRDMVVSWITESSKCSKVLCVGHNNGHTLIELGSRNCEVANPDLSRAVLMKARLSKNSMLLKDVEFCEWDMEKGLTIYPDSVFNCVVLFHTLHYLSDPGIAISEYFRMLKPSGGIFLVEPQSPNRYYQSLDLNGGLLRGELESAGFRMNSTTYVDSDLVTTALKPRYYFEMSGYKFLSAETREDLERVFRLRYQVYCLELGVEEKNASRLLKDPYDEYAVNFLALDKNDQPIGTLRAVLDNPKGFPMERDCKLREYMVENGISRAVEGSRFAIDKSLPVEDRAVIGFGLMKGLIDYCRETGVNDIFNITQLKVLKRFEVTGFRPIGEPFEYTGRWSGVIWVPMHCDISEVYGNYEGTVKGYNNLP